MTTTEQNLVEVKGEVVKILTFDSGYAILTVATSAHQKCTLVGEMPRFAEGVNIRALAEQVNHAKYGVQFRVREIEETGFSTEDALTSYLASPAFPGIGQGYARKIVEHLGLQTLATLDTDPQKLFSVPGLPEVKAQMLVEHWQKERAVHQLMSKLMTMGLTLNIAMKVSKHFGDMTTRIVAEQPYRLIEVHGVGFHKADEIALRNGVSRNSEDRVQAAIIFTMEAALNNGGNCYLGMSVVCDTVVELLKRDVSPEDITKSMRLLQAKAHLTIDGGRVYLSHIYEAEKRVAETLATMMDYRGNIIYDNVDAMRADVTALNLPFALAPEQEEAVMSALNSRVAIITGGPGTGKSTITKAIIGLMQLHDIDFRLCSPTGRAAKRLAEATGEEASTIHRLLGFDPAAGGFLHNESNPLSTECLIVDEVSMVDIMLFNSLLAATDTNTRLILVGDADQLPSVGPGNVLRDLIASEMVPVVKLQRIFRQDKGSAIVEAAHNVLHGKLPDLPTPRQSKGRNFMFAGAEQIQEVIEILLHIVTKTLPSLGLGPNDIQVLTPMREKGLGINDLNPHLQLALNPPDGTKLEVDAGMVSGVKRIFRNGDRVMQISNNYDKGVFNGDQGFIVAVDKSGDASKIWVKFSDMETPIAYEKSEFDDLLHSWAITVHKCISHDQRVLTRERGMIPIGSLDCGEFVWTGNGEYRKVLDVIETGSKEINQIRTRSGYTINASAEHPILTYTPEGYQFVQAQDLQPGTKICISREVCQGKDMISLPKSQQLGKPWTQPQFLTEDMAWLLGVIVGDGSYRDSHDGTVDITSQDIDVLDRATAIFQSMGLKVGRYQMCGKNASRIYVISKSFRKWLFEIGLEYVCAPKKHVPEMIFQAKPSLRGAFLRGLFDTDGCAGSAKARLTTSSEVMSEQVQDLLLSLGIVSVRKSRPSTRSWSIAVSGPSLLPFSKMVGFTINYKSNLLNQAISAQFGKTNLDTIPWGYNLLRICDSDLQARGAAGLQSRRNMRLRGIASAAFRHNLDLSYAQIDVVTQHYLSLGIELPDALQKRVANNYFYDTVSDVVNLGKSELMFDIEVDGLHSFASRGFVCHNSQGGEWGGVVMVAHTSQRFMMQRNLFYTGITRAKKICVVVGTESAVQAAVNNARELSRNTTLASRLKEA